LARFLDPERVRVDLQVITLVMPVRHEQEHGLLESAEELLAPDLIIRVTGVPSTADGGLAAT
jgi:hypothetical protein